ncbi:cytochrome P450 2C29-like [Bufo bufo]|uniref:cytochrome P450 2C29-like n=1 Tax=Bufo bufo TaxID=8384 RepID=UPI001ABE0E9F|nr:cytochrome P450 2C29-like [Bufo bufo]XP_040290383.1 cytochrome P450 2C29-like [Bufo bufo]XP_040290384.1 cytochrome P450 2C29-like [Bufo bufo]
MELLTVLALSLVSLLTIFILISWARQHRYRSLPPGPTPIPVLGTPKYMDLRNVTMKFQKLSQEYGTVFTIWKMSEPVIVLYGYETVKEALVDHRDQFSGRPTIPAMHAFSKGYDINGPRWRPLRRFTSATLKNFGMGNKTLEMRLLSESKCLIQAMSETGGKPFNPKMFLACTVGNIISSVLFGDHFDFQDEKLQDLLAYTSRFVTAISSPLSTLCNTVPALLKVPVIRHQVLKRTKSLATFVTNYIKCHKETLNPESHRDYMDHYLMKMKEVEHEMDPDFCETSLLAIVSGLLAAGTYTMTSTLKFSLVVMAHFPEIQAKVQQEIAELTRSLRLPEIMDKPQLPYTNAVIHEVQRILDLSPVALFHATTEEVKFRSYTIPKGAIVIPFLTSVLTDPSQWETPEEFNPGHFLDEDGQFRTRPAFMPFSTGRRSCLGEHMARMEIFLIFSALLQKFTFTLPPGAKRQNAKFLNSNKHQIIASGEICAELRPCPSDHLQSSFTS